MLIFRILLTLFVSSVMSEHSLLERKQYLANLIARKKAEAAARSEGSVRPGPIPNLLRPPAAASVQDDQFKRQGTQVAPQPQPQSSSQISQSAAEKMQEITEKIVNLVMKKVQTTEDRTNKMNQALKLLAL